MWANLSGGNVISAGQAFAALRHFASSGKSRNDVVAPTQPVDAPLAANITIN